MPIVLGHEAAGIMEATGPDARGARSASVAPVTAGRALVGIFRFSSTPISRADCFLDELITARIPLDAINTALIVCDAVRRSVVSCYSTDQLSMVLRAKLSM